MNTTEGTETTEATGIVGTTEGTETTETAEAMDEGRLAEEFRERTGWSLPGRRPNRLEEGQPRLDVTFQMLSGWCFDNPGALEPLRDWARDLVGRHPRPRAFEVLGYLEYLARDWNAAARAFMRSLDEEPENLDAWVDLAFSLKHAGLALGESILFDHDEWIRLACQDRQPLTLAGLYRLHARVAALPHRLEATAEHWIASYQQTGQPTTA